MFRGTKTIQSLCKKLFIFLITLNSVQVLPLPEGEASRGVYDDLAQLYLPGLSSENRAEQREIKRTHQENEKIAKKKRDFFSFNALTYDKAIDPELYDVEALSLAYDIFQEHHEKKHSPAHYQLPQQVCKDLSVFYSGDEHSPDHNIFKHLDQTTTIIGKIQLQKMLYEVLTDTQELKKRQAIIKTLLTNEKLFNDLETQLKTIKNHEKNILWLWKDHPDAVREYYNLPYFQSKLIPEACNRSETALAFNDRRKTLIDPLLATLLAPLYMVTCEWGAEKIDAYEHGTTARPFTKIIKDKWNNLGFYWRNLTSIILTGKKIKQETKWDDKKNCFIMQEKKQQATPTLRLLYTGGALFGAYSLYQSVSTALQIGKTHNNAANNIHKKLIGAACFFGAVQSIQTKTKTHKELEEGTPFVKETTDTINKTNAKKKTHHLLEKLKSPTFTGEPGMQCFRGKVLAAFPILQGECHNFIDLMKFVGTIDAYVSIAKYCKALPHEKFCFPEYTQTNKPHLEISELWHPMLSPHQAVTNDVLLSGSSNLNQNMIITGPNAGGKSTFLRETVIAVIMAQTFGIAPAKKMRLAPFSLIETYLNITDTTGSQSLFQAEADRTARIIKNVQGLNDNEFGLCIFDEIYTGTDDETAIKEAISDIKQLSKQGRNIAIYATHHHNLARHFETQKRECRITNYKVSVQEETLPTGEKRYTSTYKLTLGISNQKIGSSVCTDARKKYQTV